MAQASSSRARRTFGDVLMSMGAIGIVVIVLFAFDGRLRQEVRERISRSSSPTELIDGGGRVREVMKFGVAIVKTESREHPTLMLFVVAAAVLTLFMVRT